jgi:hypothetical protein
VDCKLDILVQLDGTSCDRLSVCSVTIDVCVYVCVCVSIFFVFFVRVIVLAISFYFI